MSFKRIFNFTGSWVHVGICVNIRYTGLSRSIFHTKVLNRVRSEFLVLIFHDYSISNLMIKVFSSIRAAHNKRNFHEFVDCRMYSGEDNFY